MIEKLYWNIRKLEATASTKIEGLHVLGYYWKGRIFTLDKDSLEHIERTRVGDVDDFLKMKDVCHMINRHTFSNITSDTKHFIYETYDDEERYTLTVLQGIFGMPEHKQFHFDSWDRLVEFTKEA
ncbi:hypothetical protein NSQ26_14050 [Bacillus sp. FSL W7-1360]